MCIPHILCYIAFLRRHLGRNVSDYIRGECKFDSYLEDLLYKFLFTRFSFLLNFFFEASRGTGAQSVNEKSTGCRFDPHSRKWNIYLHLYFHFFALVSRKSAVLSSVTQYATPPELGEKWGTTVCLNTRFPLPTLLCAGYSVKLI